MKLTKTWNPGASLVGGIFGTALVLTATLSAQDPNVVVDQYGTEYAPELIPPSVEADAVYPDGGGTVGNGGGSVLKPQQQGSLSTEPLVGRLDGIVLVPTPGDVIPGGVPGVRGIWHDLEEFPTRVGNSLNQYVGAPVSLASLDAMVKDTIKAYRESDRPVVDVLVPEQDITSGVIQLVVVEGRLNTIRVQGADRETTEYLKGQMRTKKGDVLRSSEILSDLAWMNRSPSRRVDLVYAPGFEFATTDIILRTNEIDPFTFYFGYENSGNELLGEDRFLMGATWAEAWGPDRTLSYQLTTDIEFESLTSHSVVYSLPLPWRHALTILGAYVDSEATVDVDGVPLDISGESWQLSSRYAMPIRWWAPENASHELEWGFDFKSSNNNLEFGGDQFFDATTEILQFSLGYNLLAQHRRGATRLDLTGYYSPGGLTTNNSSEVFQESRAGADASYTYATASIERSQRLARDMTARLRAQGQVSSDNLLASEQLGIGGPSTVRGYNTSVARGDEGFLVSAEVYSPTYSVAQWFGWRGTTDEFRMLVFADYASVSNVDLADGEASSQSLFSVGLGMRMTYDEWLRLRLDLGFPISDNLDDNIDVDSARLHIGATANF